MTMKYPYSQTSSGMLLEVHAVHGPDDGREAADGEPRRDGAHVVVLADGDDGQVGIEGVRQQGPEVGGGADDAGEVVLYVSEVRRELRVGAGQRP